jgi:hypothetical protein
MPATPERVWRAIQGARAGAQVDSGSLRAARSWRNAGGVKPRFFASKTFSPFDDSQELRAAGDHSNTGGGSTTGPNNAVIDLRRCIFN